VSDPQPSELLLSSGAEAFDVGSVMFYGLSTDKADYPTGTEPVTAIVTAYGTIDSTLELQLDGVTIKTEAISLTETVTINTNIGIVNPGPHTLKAILTAGGVESTKETTFTYAMSLFDSDYDGMPTEWENAHGLDPNNPDDAGLDPDNDGLTNIEEYWSGTDPKNPDTDNDGMDDGWEVTYGLDPLVNDASGDKDGDGYSNLFEYQKGSNPSDPASIPMPAQISVERVLLQEDFSSGIPESWFVAGTWSGGCEGGRSIGQPFEWPWAIVDSSCALTYDERLYAPVFDAGSCSTLTLRFSSFFEPGTDGTASIAVSDDYGETWTEVMTMTGTAGPETQEIDINALAGKEEALIEFRYASPGGALGNRFWAIDNVEVLCGSVDLQFKALYNTASAPQTLIISNRGDLDLKIDDIVLSGNTGFSLDNNQCAGKTLISQGECTVDVVFTPPPEGATGTGTLSFISNDSGAPKVTLSGKGVQFLVEPEQGGTGTEITLTGTEFGMKKGSVLLGTTALKVLDWQGDLIHALLSKTIPPGPYDVTVKPKEPKGTPWLVEEDAFTVITNEPPRIFWVSPERGVVGTEVTVKGVFFGSKGNLYLEYEGSKGPMKKKCKVLKWTMDPVTGDSEIVFVVPLITAGSVHVVVATSAPVPEAKQENGFTMMAPEIVSVNLSGGKAGDQIQIRGHYFGAKKGKVYLGGYEVKGKPVQKNCAVTSWVVDPTGEDVITFIVPGGLAADKYYDVIVTNSVGSATETGGFMMD
jgi:hypothetical protein